MSVPQPPRFIQLPSPASLHIMESLICYENSHSQQHPFSSTPLSTRFSKTCICLQRHSHLLFSLVNTLFYHTCSWTQSDCMLSLFLFSLYEVSLLLVHFHQIVLQSLIHTINNTNSTPLRNGSTRNINMKNQQ